MYLTVYMYISRVHQPFCIRLMYTADVQGDVHHRVHHRCTQSTINRDVVAVQGDVHHRVHHRCTQSTINRDVVAVHISCVSKFIIQLK